MVKAYRVDDSAVDVWGGEGLDLIGDDDEIGKRVESECGVMRPVDGADARGQRGQVSLRYHSLRKL